MKLNPEAVEVILIEDSMDDAELILRILKKKGHFGNTMHLMDGAEALSKLISNIPLNDAGFLQPKLIILDIKMPKVDGFTVLEKLRAHKWTQLIPVLVFSSSKHEKDIKRAYKLGANCFLVKPLDYDEFVFTVEQIVEFWLKLNTNFKYNHISI